MPQMTIEITDECRGRLETIANLANFPSPEHVVARLVEHADEGIRRPDAWEREWIAKVVGPGPVATYDRRNG